MAEFWQLHRGLHIVSLLCLVLIIFRLWRLVNYYRLTLINCGSLGVKTLAVGDSSLEFNKGATKGTCFAACALYLFACECFKSNASSACSHCCFSFEYCWIFFTLAVFAFLANDGAPKSLHQEEIKANICGIMDREINSLSSKLVVWVPLNVTSMHVPDR